MGGVFDGACGCEVNAGLFLLSLSHHKRKRAVTPRMDSTKYCSYAAWRNDALRGMLNILCLPYEVCQPVFADPISFLQFLFQECYLKRSAVGVITENPMGVQHKLQVL